MKASAKNSSTARRKVEPKWVGVSVAEPDGPLGPGIGKEHIQEAVVRISRILLRNGVNLAYGGDLRPDGFTRVLFDVARAESVRESTATHKVRPQQWTRRLASYLAWPFSDKLTSAFQAQLVQYCRFVKIEPEGFKAIRPRLETMSEVEHKAWIGVSLSTLRERMQDGKANDDDEKRMSPLAGRIVLGGKCETFQGFMPGIWEEAALALKAKVPLLLFGGFGGAAHQLAELFLHGETKLAPFEKRRKELESISIPPSCHIGKPAELIDFLIGIGKSKDRLAQLRLEWRESEKGKALSEADARKRTELMLTTNSVDQACRLAAQAIPGLKRAQKVGGRTDAAGGPKTTKKRRSKQ